MKPHEACPELNQGWNLLCVLWLLLETMSLSTWQFRSWPQTLFLCKTEASPQDTPGLD